MALDSMPDKLMAFLKKDKVFISKKNYFNEIAKAHGKGKFSKIKGGICNISIEVGYICNIFPRNSTNSFQ